MVKSSLGSKPMSNQSVNISVIKSNGIASVWNWFTNKNKKGNLQNLMFDKKFKLKLNAEELDALKVNGIDLQKLQNIAANSDNKTRKNIFILSKDQSELNKNALLNSSVLYDLMKNKNVPKRPKKYKKSVVSSSSLSIKSKNNVINSNVTYVQSIKSKKSIINSVSSKASFKVGLKSKTVVLPMNPTNKNILMKGIPEALLKGNSQKKVFVPIYLGKKKSSKTSKGENNKNVENKNKSENESNVIPLLLTKLKAMEGQINDIENTTKKINEAVSQKTLCNLNNSSKVNKDNTAQPNNKGIATHKMYPKRSFKKFKQSKTNNIQSKTNIPTSKTNLCNTDLSFNGVAGLKNKTVTINKRNKITNIKNIFDSPENFINHHTFVIPSDLSEKNLFQANPNVGCDVMLKLFEALTESHKSINNNRVDDTQTKKSFTNIDDIDSPRRNASDTISELGRGEKPKGLSSISESQMCLLNQNKNCSQQKKNISCPSSSTAVTYTDYSDEQGHPSNNILNFEIGKDNDQLNKMPESERNNINNEIKSMRMDKIDDDKINNPSGNKPYIFFYEKESEEDEAKYEARITKEGFEVQKYEETSNSKSLNSPKKANSIEAIVENDLQMTKMVPDNKMYESSIKTKSDDLNLKVEDNINLQCVKLQVTEGQLEKQVINVPIATDSTNICSICIEPTPAKLSEVEIKGSKLCLDTKKEPKFSITILVKNKLNDETSYNNDVTMSNNHESEKKPSSEVAEDQQCDKVQKNIPVNDVGGSTSHQSAEKNVNFNSEKYIPPLKLEISNTTPISLATCGFVDKSNFSKEKSLDKLNMDHKIDEFGMRGVIYLNQEQRKKLDSQISNLVSNKKCQELKNTTLKSAATSSINLKCNYTPVKHLSESSLNFQKTAVRNKYKQTTQPSGKTLNKSIKNCRKNPYDSLEFLKFRNEPDATNTLQANHNNMKLPKSKGLDYGDKAISRSKEECYILRDSRKSLNNISYFDVTSKTLTENNNKTGHKQDFLLVRDEKPVVDSRSTEDPNPSYIKKRSHRCHMTLKEPTLNDLTDNPLYDKMCIGDHQTKSIQLISTKEIACSTPAEIFEKSNAILSSLKKKTPTTNLLNVMNVGPADKSNCMPSQSERSANKVYASHGPADKSNCMSSQSERSANKVYASHGPADKSNCMPSQSERSANKVYALHGPKTPKYPGVIIQSTTANNSEVAKHSNDQSNGAVTSQGLGSVETERYELYVPEQVCNCTCVDPEKPCIEDLNRALVPFSNRAVVKSEPKTSDTPECKLVSLSVTDIPKCCKCILEKTNTTTDTAIRSQAEILLEKSGVQSGKMWNISIICNTCLGKSNTKSIDQNQETYNTCKYLSINRSERNLKENKFFSVQLEEYNIKNEITTEVLQSNPARSESQLTKNENDSHSFLGNTNDKSLHAKKETKYEEKNKMSCYHPCLNVPSDDSMSGDISDKNPQNTFCLDVVPESEFSNEHNIGNEVLRFYSNKNEAYSMDNMANSTTVFQFNGKEDVTYYKIIPDENPGTCQGTKDNNESTEFMECKENRDNTKYMKYTENNKKTKYFENKENNDNRSLISINCSQKDPYKSVVNANNSYAQYGTQSNLTARDNWSSNVNPVGTSKTVYSDSVPNRQHQYLTENNQTTIVQNGTYKSFKRSMLKTIKENEFDQNSHTIGPNVSRYLPSQIVRSSTNYIVNCVHSVEYDFMSEKRNAIFACSVNSYSSTNS